MPPSSEAMKGKVCLVTGATSGLGKATATALAAQGATVVLACRNREKGEAVKQEIARATGNDSLDLMVADLASIESTKKGAADFLARYPQLHVLVNQAGLGVTGRYFIKRKEAKSSARSHDKELAARLWKVSAELTGLKV